MSTKITTVNGVKIYELTPDERFPVWLTKDLKKEFKKDESFDQRIHLLESLEFKATAQNMKLSPRCSYLGCVGTYPPALRLLSTKDLAIKTDRSVDGDIVDFVMLADDWEKQAVLLSDRRIQFHGRQGYFYQVRVPHAPRVMAYDKYTCDLFVAGTSNQITRFSLSSGHFLEPLILNGATFCETLVVSDQTGLLAAGTDHGMVSIIDPKDGLTIGTLDVASIVKDMDLFSYVCVDPKYEPQNITALCWSPCGYFIAVGLACGAVVVFDIRSSSPVSYQDHRYEEPINSISFTSHPESELTDEKYLILSADSHAVRIWNMNSRKLFTSINENKTIKHALLYPESGLIFIASEAKSLSVYFIPSVGPAPTWCYFLDSIVQEDNEKSSTEAFDGFRFVPEEFVGKHNLFHLVGTDQLKSALHGYYIDIRLYRNLLKQSTSYADIVKESERIGKIRNTSQDQQSTTVAEIVDDDRFAAMFDEDFE